MSNIEELVNIIVIENGKTKDEAKKEILYGAKFLKWFAQIPEHLEGSLINISENKKIFLSYEPVGPVGAITPWNFPLAMILRKIAPALAAGCTIVLKPSELTPYSANAIAFLIKEAGFAPNVVNIIHTDAELFGDAICQSNKIKKISFTGSTRVGSLLYKKAACTFKKISLELGGNAPLIVDKNVNIDKVAKDIVLAKIRNAGQACVSVNRLYVHSDIKDELLKKVTAMFQELQVGSGFDLKVNIGPLINSKSLEKIQSLMDDAILKGAKILTGGFVIKDLLFSPTIIDNCNENMRIFSEEIFGPVLAVYSFDTKEEVLESANNTIYGLASYVFSNDNKFIWYMTEKLNFGMVGVNTPFVSEESGAFGGRNNSGFGVEGSNVGIYEYLITKYINYNI